MRLWQKCMIALATSDRVTAYMQRNAQASALATRFVGGADKDAAVDRARAIEETRAKIAFEGRSGPRVRGLCHDR